MRVFDPYWLGEWSAGAVRATEIAGGLSAVSVTLLAGELGSGSCRGENDRCGLPGNRVQELP